MESLQITALEQNPELAPIKLFMGFKLFSF